MKQNTAIELGPTPAALPQGLRTALAGVSFATFGHFIEAGLVDPAIRAQVPGGRAAGRALTVRITTPDSAPVHHATTLVEQGDVLVIDAGGDRRHASVGEMVALAVKARGGAGIVIDGVCTDVLELRAMGLPVFARGTSLLTTKLRALDGAVNVPVTCGGRIVTPGDVVLADENGVLVLPPAVAAALLPEATALESGEPATRAYLRDGGSLAARFGADEIVLRIGRPAGGTTTAGR